MTHKPRHSRGYTLVEMLVYITVFSMAAVVCAKLFANTTRLSLHSTQIVDRMNATREVQRDFLETVRAAVAVAPGVGEHRTDDHTLTLQLHHENEAPRYAVLGLLGGDRLHMLEVCGSEDEWRVEKFMTWRLPLTAATFEVDPSGRRVTLALQTSPHDPQHPEGGRDWSFVATLRSNATGGQHQ